MPEKIVEYRRGEGYEAIDCKAENSISEEAPLRGNKETKFPLMEGSPGVEIFPPPFPVVPEKEGPLRPILVHGAF